MPVSYYFVIFIWIFLFCIWLKYGKDYPLTGVVDWQIPNLSPAQCGYILGGKVKYRHLTVMILFWATRGYIKIINNRVASTISFQKLKDLPQSAAFFERLMFIDIFQGEISVNLQVVKDRFFHTYEAAKNALEDSSEDLFYEAQSIRKKLMMRLILYFCVVLCGVILELDLGRLIFQSGQNEDFLFVFILTLLPFWLFSLIMPRRTQVGVKVYQELFAFKKFLKSANSNRLKPILQEKIDFFGQTFPYAVAFGLGNEWAAKFNDFKLETPEWYLDTAEQTNQNDQFIISVSRVTSQIESVLILTIEEHLESLKPKV